MPIIYVLFWPFVSFIYLYSRYRFFTSKHWWAGWVFNAVIGSVVYMISITVNYYSPFTNLKDFWIMPLVGAGFMYLWGMGYAFLAERSSYPYEIFHYSDMSLFFHSSILGLLLYTWVLYANLVQ